MSILQRIRDWRHARLIRRLADRCCAARTAGDRIRTRLYWYLMIDAVKARSAGQVARMELRAGLRTRTAIKQHVMRAFWRGLLPASVVTFVFRLFRLRSL